MRELDFHEIDNVYGATTTAVGSWGIGIEGVAAAGLAFSEFGPLEWGLFGIALGGFYFGCGGNLP
jgi:hypothetical protein